MRELGVSRGRWRSVGGAEVEEEAWVLPGAQGRNSMQPEGVVSL